MIKDEARHTWNWVDVENVREKEEEGEKGKKEQEEEVMEEE